MPQRFSLGYQPPPQAKALGHEKKRFHWLLGSRLGHAQLVWLV